MYESVSSKRSYTCSNGLCSRLSRGLHRRKHSCNVFATCFSVCSSTRRKKNRRPHRYCLTGGQVPENGEAAGPLRTGFLCRKAGQEEIFPDRPSAPTGSAPGTRSALL